MSRLSGENLKKNHMTFLNNCCLKVVIFSLIFYNIYNSIIVFSLVDKRAGFSNPEFVGSYPDSAKKTFFVLFLFFFLKH